jgi:3-hydroxyacyl-[acyl-carrier-protein] dehydratase
MSHASTQHDRLLALPHREPFLFLSELTELDPGRQGKAHWRVAGGEVFFRGHFPGNPVVPGVLLGESLAQLAGLVAFSDGQNAVAAQRVRLSRLDLKFPLAVNPPADVHLEATLTRRLDELVMFDVRATVADRSVAVGSLVLSCTKEPNATSAQPGGA